MIKTDNGDYIMSDFDIVSSIDWHDGVLLEVKTTFKESHFNMTLFIDIYKSENIREKMIVEFSDVDDLVFAMDSAELIDNHKSENISNGYIKKLKNKRIYKFFFIFLTISLIHLNTGLHHTKTPMFVYKLPLFLRSARPYPEP